MSINFNALAAVPLPLTLNPGPPRENINQFLRRAEVSLNPQPLPPKNASSQFLSPGSTVSLNPQPLPPRIAGLQFLSPGSTVSINPQPLPPKDMLQSMYLNPGILVELNPQPLPPGPDPEALNLWTHSAVLNSRGTDSMQWFHDNRPDPAPVLNGVDLG